MTEYIVKRNLNHNGKDYTPDQLIELDEKVAAPLIADGVIASIRPGSDDSDEAPEMDIPSKKQKNPGVSDEGDGSGDDAGKTEGDKDQTEGPGDQNESGDRDGDNGNTQVDASANL